MVYFYWRGRVISPIMEKKVKGEQVMKKKKQRQTQRQTQMNQVKNESITIGDQLNTSLMDQLKSKKKELQVRAEQKEIEEQERKRKEQKEREKNKSFEELLSESNLTWKDFK